MPKTPLTPDADLPSRVGPCRPLFELGAGGMGSVHLAELIEPLAGLPPGSRVALKVLHAGRTGDPGSIARFEREGQLGASLSHPGLVRVLAHGVTTDSPPVHWLAMEHVEGRTLRSVLGAASRLPEPLARDIVAQLARALHALHAVGAIHRDVKPENILLTPDHHVKLADLGVARSSEGDTLTTAEGLFVGSLSYASPEHLGVGAPCPATDLYSLGVVLYEAISGERPFRAPGVAELIRLQLERAAPPLGDSFPDVSPFLEAVVASLLDKDPARRFASAAVLADTLAAGEASPWWIQHGLTGGRERGGARVPVRRDQALVGRSGELSQLRRGLSDAAAGNGRVILLQGEPGIGKSRLLDELVREANATGAWNVLYGSYPPGEQGDARGAIADALVGLFGRQALRDELARRLPATPRLVPSLAALLLGDIPERATDRLPTSIVGSALAQVLLSLASERPTLWIVDDLHFASQDDRTLVARLAREATGQRLLVIVATRPGVPAADLALFERLENTSSIAVPRLEEQAIDGLLAAALGSTSLATRLRARVAGRSDGNPFFLLALVRELEDRGVLRRAESGDWSITSDAHPIEVPSSVRGLVLARLQGLEQSERDILDVAAVQGYQFDPDLLARVLSRRRLEVLQALASLERRTGLVRGEGSLMRFDHHQLQEVIAETLSAPLREAYHLALATEFAQREGIDAESRAPVSGPAALFLARHALAGGDHGLATRHLLAAIQHLQATGRPLAAVMICDGAIQAIGEALDPNLVIELGTAVWTDAVLLRAQPDVLQRLEECLRHVERSKEELTALRATICRQAMVVRDVERRAEAWVLIEQTMARARALGVTRQIGLALQHRGSLLREEGRFEEALVAQLESIALGEARTVDHFNMALTLGELGRYEESRSYFELSLEAFTKEISPLRLLIAQVSWGWILTAMGDLEKARTCLDANASTASGLGLHGLSAVSMVNAAEIARLEGRVDDVEALATSAVTSGGTRTDPRTHAYAMRRLADAKAARGDFEAALVLQNEALDLRRRDCGREAIAESCIHVARVLVALDRKEEAVTLLREADDLATAQAMADVGVLAAAWLAALGERDPASVTPTPRCVMAVRIETELLLYRASRHDARLAGAAANHLAEARRLLDVLHRHLSGDALATARSGWPVAAEIVQLSGG